MGHVAPTLDLLELGLPSTESYSFIAEYTEIIVRLPLLLASYSPFEFFLFNLIVPIHVPALHIRVTTSSAIPIGRLTRAMVPMRF